ncbi:MAG: hypothetical protein M0R75_12465 [Dehalococcoidia bacterium]|nr:hypothetical protein [Dehalococcoidia bacterium]
MLVLGVGAFEEPNTSIERPYEASREGELFQVSGWQLRRGVEHLKAVEGFRPRSSRDRVQRHPEVIRVFHNARWMVAGHEERIS